MVSPAHRLTAFSACLFCLFTCLSAWVPAPARSALLFSYGLTLPGFYFCSPLRMPSCLSTDSRGPVECYFDEDDGNTSGRTADSDESMHKSCATMLALY
jgi:hypothetical protein